MAQQQCIQIALSDWAFLVLYASWALPLLYALTRLAPLVEFAIRKLILGGLRALEFIHRIWAIALTLVVLSCAALVWNTYNTNWTTMYQTTSGLIQSNEWTHRANAWLLKTFA